MFGNQNEMIGVCKFDIMENNFFIVFDYVIMPHNMMILYFRLPCFYVSNSALFFT